MSLITDLTTSTDGGATDLFSWERTIQRSWAELEVDQYGQLEYNKLQRSKQLTRKHKLTSRLSTSTHLLTTLVEKGMIRYMYLIVDCTHSMNVNDYKPTRKLALLDILKQFIIEYFDQNPISQLGIICTHNSIAYRLTELSGNPTEQIRRLVEYIDGGGSGADDVNAEPTSGGELSIQNSLMVAESSLKQIPSYGSRELIFIHSSLYSIDPSDIYKTVDSLVTNSITCNVISLTAEMYICGLLCQRTAGTFSVALNKQHLKELLFNHVAPSPLLKQRIKQIQRRWIKMGFPTQVRELYPTLCACHQQLKYGGYVCPKCFVKVCELPTECPVCGTTLILSSHLARTYHHLFPVPPYDLLDKHTDTSTNHNKAATANDNGTTNGSADDNSDVQIVEQHQEQWPDTQCYSCLTPMSYTSHIRNKCPKCKCSFCIDCDEYIHTSLHNCPGCCSTLQMDAPTAVQGEAIHNNSNASNGATAPIVSMHVT